ncbi:MAG: DNA/RNA nuclease SfsA [Ruminococcus sp.]|nr:DNA/RNA nuclease SfsA [Ruminococcus sp.]
MKYKNITKGVFIKRPNRFIAEVEIEGKIHSVHVKNTGRCREILKEGTTVYLTRSDNPNRKTEYDLIAAEKHRKNLPSLLINIDSQIPNDATEEFLRKGTIFSQDAIIRREVKQGNSRFDFYIEDKGAKAFLEVKGVTQETDSIALFPDAPTERGVKHIEELITLKKDGYEAYIFFVIQMQEISVLKPNDITHKAFGDALRKAENAGVKILAYDCIVTPDSMVINKTVPIDLTPLVNS